MHLALVAIVVLVLAVSWWLTGKLNWLPMKDINQDALVELARNQLDPMGSALSASATSTEITMIE